MGNDKNIRKPKTRIVALVTYIIALVGLLIGLLLPSSFEGENIIGNMLLMQLPAAVNGIYELEFLKEFAANNPFTLSFGLAFGEFTLDLGAIFALLYALVTVAGVVALIPVIANAVSKKARKNVALRAASFIEALAFAVVAPLLLGYLFNYLLASGLTEIAFTAYPVVGACGGLFLMLAVQAFFYKKGSGFIKFILALLGLVTVLAGVYDITAIIPQLAEPLEGLKQEWLGLGFVTVSDGGATISASAIFYATAILNGYTVPENVSIAVIEIMSAIVAYLVIINFILDVMGMGKRTSRWMLITNVIRYALEIAAVAVVVIMAAITEGATIGLFSLVIAVLALVAFIIDIIRLVTFKSRKKAKNEKPAEVTAEVKEGEEAPVQETRKERKAREKAEKLAAKEAKKASKQNVAVEEEPEQQPEEAPVSVYSNDAEGNVVYTPVIYNGPTDDFIRTLNNDQKLEFSRIFLERQASALTCIPDYNVGGKNDKFFASVFIYYSKVRDLVSDGLMNEIYKQANMMK